jgi:hydrogenase nickel incorporation protein HypA/HybF
MQIKVTRDHAAYLKTSVADGRSAKRRVPCQGIARIERPVIVAAAIYRAIARSLPASVRECALEQPCDGPRRPGDPGIVDVTAACGPLTITRAAMHELAVCQGMLAQVERVATAHGASGVTRILITVGPLSGIEAQLLERAFCVARAGTLADGATLEIEAAPVRVHCTACGAESDAAVNRLVCDACGDWRLQLLGGDELLLKRIELTGLELGERADETATSTQNMRALPAVCS